MPRWVCGLKLVRIGVLCAIAGVCLSGVGVRAALPVASRPASSQPAAARPRPSPGLPGAALVSEADFQAYYQARLAAIKPDDAEGLYSLALFCSNKEHSDLAVGLCRQILETRPAHVKAKALLRALTLRLAATSRPADSPASRVAMTQPFLTIGGVLSPGAINRLRFGEFHVEDMTDRPRVSLSKQIIQEFLDEASTAQSMTDLDKRLFNKAPNDDKLRWIVKIAGERYIDRIALTSEPRSMVTFRQKVWPIISRGCAAPNCHGGEKAGHLRFVLPVSVGPAMATNFYITSQFEAGEGRFVNRERAEASLLLQFGLSPEQASLKHPVAIARVFASPNDAKYQIVLKWIRQLRSPVPDYRISERMWQGFPGRATVPPAK